MAFGPGKQTGEPYPGSKSGCASLLTRVCAQKRLTPARHSLGRLGQRRPGTNSYAPKGALLHWPVGPKLDHQLGPRGPKTALSPRKSLRLMCGAAHNALKGLRTEALPSSTVAVSGVPAVCPKGLHILREPCWTSGGQLGRHSLYSIGFKNNSPGCTIPNGRHLRL